ncbi:acyl-CoA thioesterase [Yoonia sp. R2331]|uniref:acyl-CoA thioesterase n=1 Tax=Yoonia sp. R2331 TaxID=3237238 RepID=UPI0034E5B49C
MVFTFPQKVLFRHCDPAGIVFYPRYFEMINDCVEAFFAKLGFPFEDIHKQSGVPTAQIETRFSAPSRHGDELLLTLAVARVGRSSLGLEIDAHAGRECRFSCSSTLVYINETGRAAPWPADLKTAFTPYHRSTT